MQALNENFILTKIEFVQGACHLPIIVGNSGKITIVRHFEIAVCFLELKYDRYDCRLNYHHLHA